MLDDQLSSDDNDREEDKLPLRDHEPIYHSPMPQHPTSSFPSPHTRQKEVFLLLLLHITPLPIPNPREKRILLPLLFVVPYQDLKKCHLNV
jgi:hypothetical protein